MNLLIYELKKVFSKKTVLFILILFLFLDVFKINSIYREKIVSDALSEGRQTVINEIKGPITIDKLSFIINKKKELDKLIEDGSYKTEYDDSTYTGYQFGDYTVFNEIYEELNYVYHYNEYLQTVKKKATENMALYPVNSYEHKLASKILDTYENRNIGNYYDTVGYEAYFSYDFSTLMILLFLLFALAPIFSSESEIGMDLLILSTPKGKTATALAKLVTVILISFFVTILFLFLDLFMFNFLFNLEGGQNPLYSLQSFSYTTFKGSVIQYAIFSALLKLWGSLFFGFVYTLFSCPFKNSLPSLVSAGCCLLLVILGNDFVIVEWLNHLSPLVLFTNRIVFQEFSQINFLERPIENIYVILIITVLMNMILFFLIIQIQSKKNNSCRSHRRKII